MTGPWLALRLLLLLLCGAAVAIANLPDAKLSPSLETVGRTSVPATGNRSADDFANSSPMSLSSSSRSGCPTGFEAGNASAACIDIDECQNFVDRTASTEEDRRDVCGNYVHSHRHGYRCVNTPGSYRCERIVDCGFGYKLNEELGTCIDVDECEILGYEAACGLTLPIKVCVNLEGSFRCDYRTCEAGLHLDRSTGQCNPCRQGYEEDGQGACVDVNECVDIASDSINGSRSPRRNSCPPHMRCVNYEGGYECRHKIFCPMGRRANYNGTLCIDIDECAEHSRICGVGRNCINLDGSYRCESKQCEKLQELNSKTGECVCTEGFRMNATSRMCEDIDECAERRHNCDANDVCRNTRGHFDCLSRDKVCEPGFGLNFDHSACVDIDECRLGHYKCAKHEVCNNTHGSYACLCATGFQRIGDTRECTDIDECAANGTLLCQSPLICHNKPGSYACACPNGYRRELPDNGTSITRLCTDIDECSEQPGICGAAGSCQNTPGGYTCACPPGYMATDIVGGTCADIDECKLNACPIGAVCRNTPGGYDCQCRPGLLFDRRSNLCEDVDECQESDNDCASSNSSCFNYRGLYACYNDACPDGFAQLSSKISQSNSLAFSCSVIGKTCQPLPSLHDAADSTPASNSVCVKRHRMVQSAKEIRSGVNGSVLTIQSDMRLGRRDCQFRATLIRVSGRRSVAFSVPAITTASSEESAVSFKRRHSERYTMCTTDIKMDGGDSPDPIKSALVEVALISGRFADISNNTVHFVYLH